jgi:quinol-cytochrome oxidoreductase complex cytochrome b subunit
MDIWTVPMIIVVLIICMIGLASVRKMHQVDAVVKGQDSAIPKAIEEHPYTLNPIIWIILIAAFFIGIVIFYYATSS